MSSAVCCGLAGRLHDVAEHDAHDQVDGRVEASGRQHDVVRRHSRPHHGLGGLEQRLGVRGQQGQQLGVGAVRGRDDGLEEAVVLGQLEHPEAGAADGRDEVVRVVVERPLDLGQEQGQLAQHHLLGQPGLGADLVVDGLTADPDPVGELAHRDGRPAGLGGQLGRRGHDALVGTHPPTLGRLAAGWGVCRAIARRRHDQSSGLGARPNWTLPACRRKRRGPVFQDCAKRATSRHTTSRR